MAKRFSLKRFEDVLVPSKVDLQYLNSAAYKKRCKKADAKMPVDLKNKISVLQNQIKKIKKADFLKIRALIKKDSAEILESMRYYAESQKWILPLNVDELAGFYYWLLNDNKIDVGEDENNRKIIKLFHEYILKIDQDADNKKQAQKIENQTWKDLIRFEFHDLVESIEDRIHDKVTSWKNGKDKIGCAAYCRLIFDNKYFEKESTKVVTPVQYASMKFKIDINIQLQTSKKDSLKKHMNLLAHYFSK